MTGLEQQVFLLEKYQVAYVVVGGVAAVAHGLEYFTSDLDVCYSRAPENLERLATALCSVNARLRGAPAGLPFILDAETLRRGLNFTFDSDVGPIDLLGEVLGVGRYEVMLDDAISTALFGYEVMIISLSELLAAKRAAGRPKDLLLIPQLEALLEMQQAPQNDEGS